MRIPPNYKYLVAAWKALIRTGDSAFLKTFCEMGRAIMDAAARERQVTQPARELLTQVFTVIKECLGETDAGKSAWSSLQSYGVRVLRAKKPLQTVLGHI
jgi:hypothetical protein